MLRLGCVMENVSKCPRCGGGNVTASVRVHQTAEAGNIGLSYKTKFQAQAPSHYMQTLARIVVPFRFFVKNPARQWYTK